MVTVCAGEELGSCTCWREDDGIRGQRVYIPVAAFVALPPRASATDRIFSFIVPQ